MRYVGRLVDNGAPSIPLRVIRLFFCARTTAGARFIRGLKSAGRKRALAESMLAEVQAEQEGVGGSEEGDEDGAEERVEPPTALAPREDEPCSVGQETVARLADLSQKLQRCAADARAASNGLISIAEFLERATGLRGTNVHSDDILLRVTTPGHGSAAAMVEQVTRDGVASIGKKIKKAVSSAVSAILLWHPRTSLTPPTSRCGEVLSRRTSAFCTSPTATMQCGS